MHQKLFFGRAPPKTSGERATLPETP